MATREDKAFTMLSTSAAILSGIAMRKVLQAGYSKATGHGPPNDPTDPAVSWGQALLWGALAGAAVGLSRVAARRATAATWERLSGSPSPSLH